MNNYSKYLRGGHVTTIGVLVSVPLLLAAAVLWSGKPPPALPVYEAATMWLVSPAGQLVHANGLVAAPGAQIIDAVEFPAARSGAQVMRAAGALVAASSGSQVSLIDTRTHQTVGSRRIAASELASDGSRIYRIGDNDVTVLDSERLAPAAVHRIAARKWSTSEDALYLLRYDGGVVRINEDGAEFAGTTDGGATALLDRLPDGVAAYDPGSGIVSLIRGISSAGAIHALAGGSAFGASPDGRSVAVVTGRTLHVTTPHGDFESQLGFAPGTDPPVILGRSVYLADPDAGRIQVFRTLPGLPRGVQLDFGSSGRIRLVTHRGRDSIWFDDVSGRVAFAIHGGQARKIEKYAARPDRPTPPRTSTTTRPTATARPGTEPPVESPRGTSRASRPTTLPASNPPPSTSSRPSPAVSRTPSPANSRSVSPSPSSTTSRAPSPSASRTPSRSPSPLPSTDPREDCGGRETALEVRDASSTGPRPRIEVTVCEPASGGDEYWIVSRNDEGLWFAKQLIDERRIYRIQLRHGSGEPGQTREFLIVAGRSSGARSWLQRNLEADIGDQPFDRADLPGGTDIVSAGVSSTS
ncbi:hypothetical protein ACQP2E_11835 [Actinoplanes sp. CA-015351]|uniref:hypothetical protein n=1 Tax=Actinoplanes sp. CA-015351 TaxID=3239897 RepID=UPI003D98E73D